MTHSQPKLFGIVLAVTLGPPVLLVVALLALGVIGRLGIEEAERRALAAWEEGPGPIGAPFLAEQPKRPTNEDARALERLAAPLGIVLVPTAEERTIEVPEGRREAFEALQTKAYLVKVGSSVTDPVPPAPPALQAWCRESAGALDPLAAAVRNGEPRWTMDLPEGPAAPVPNLRGHLYLVEALAACAAARQEDEPEAANRLLEAAWRLAVLLGERPELFSNQVHILEARYVAGVARHLAAPDPGWSVRLADHDVREATARSMRGEGTMHLLASRDPGEMLRDCAGGG